MNGQCNPETQATVGTRHRTQRE